MIEPAQTSFLANKIANHSWQLLKVHLDLQFVRLNASESRSAVPTVTLRNQGISDILIKILPDLIASSSHNTHLGLNKAKINKIMANYRFAAMQNSHSLKSAFFREKIAQYAPLIAKLQLLKLNFVQPSEDVVFPQPNFVNASFPFPNAPISSEYFKFFELFHKKHLPFLKKKKPNKRKQKDSKRGRKTR